MKTKTKLLDLPIGKALVTLSVPIIFANLLQTAYQIIDTFWVGRLGPEAVAAVSLSFPFIFLMIALGGGLAIAGTILVAQYKGSKNYSQLNAVAGQAIIMTAIISAVLSIIGYFLTGPAISLMNPAPEVFGGAINYLQITFIGLVSFFGFFATQALMRGVGEVKIPMYIVAGTVLLNLIFDPLFIFGWGPIPPMGVAGAAAATIATQTLAFVISIGFLLTGKYDIRLTWQDFRLNPPLIMRMVKLGLPASIQQGTQALGFTAITFLVSGFGTQALAAYGIGGRLMSFFIIPANGLADAVSTLVGQNIGAQRHNHAEQTAKYGVAATFSVLTILGLAVYYLAAPIAALFVPNNIQTISASAHFIRIIAFTLGFIGVQMVVLGALRGAGDMSSSLVIGLIDLFVFKLLLIFILTRYLGFAEDGIWWSFAIANVGSAIVASIWFGLGKWKKVKIIDHDTEAQVDIIEEAIMDEGHV
ncbi:MAG: MATE family efflux transporter [Patescibacteria group bacterium]